GYGSVGAARAIEQLRLIAVELQMAPIRTGVHIQGADFMAVWKGGKDIAELSYLRPKATDMLDQLASWTSALKTAREQAPISPAAQVHAVTLTGLACRSLQCQFGPLKQLSNPNLRLKAQGSSCAAPSASARRASSIRSCCSTIFATIVPKTIGRDFHGIRTAGSRRSRMCWRGASNM